MSSQYGQVTAQTAPGARCTLQAQMPDFHNAPGVPNPQVADSSGKLEWDYPTYPASSGTGIHTVSCSANRLNGIATAQFIVGA
jgi:hypothetical protein